MSPIRASQSKDNLKKRRVTIISYVPANVRRESLMHKTRFFTLICWAVAAFAQPPSPSPKTPKTLVYLTPEQIEPSRLLVPPPKDGAPAQQEEMAAVKR